MREKERVGCMHVILYLRKRLLGFNISTYICTTGNLVSKSYLVHLTRTDKLSILTAEPVKQARQGPGRKKEKKTKRKSLTCSTLQATKANKKNRKKKT